MKPGPAPLQVWGRITDHTPGGISQGVGVDQTGGGGKNRAARYHYSTPARDSSEIFPSPSAAAVLDFPRWFWGRVMHLLGRDIVSEPTRRSARQLVGTALTVFLAKFYGLDLTGLKIFEVAIDPKVIAGAAVIVVLVQSGTFFAHWIGDWTSLVPWNSAERFNGMGRYSAGAEIVDRIGQLDEMIEVVQNSARQLQGQSDQAAVEKIAAEVKTAREEIERLRRSALRLSLAANVYLYGLYLALPLVAAVLAIFWPVPAP